jgi:hypothetical protein
MTLYGFGAPGCDDRGGVDRREQFVIPTADINKTTMSPLKNIPFRPISASDSKFNPRNIPYIPAVKFFAFLELERN